MKEAMIASMNKVITMTINSESISDEGLDRLDENTMLRVIIDKSYAEKYDELCLEHKDLKCGSIAIIGNFTHLRFHGNCSSLKAIYVERSSFRDIDMTNTCIEKVEIHESSTDTGCMWLKGARKIKEVIIKNSNPNNTVPFPYGITELDRLETPVQDEWTSDALKRIRVPNLTLKGLHNGNIPKMRYSASVIKLSVCTENINNLEMLSSFTGLKSLSLYCSNSLPLDVLSCLNLEKLILGNDHVNDLAFMKDMTNLRTFYLLNNIANDLSDIYHLNQITTLVLAGSVANLSFVDHLANIKHLTLTKTSLVDISALTRLGLEYLYISESPNIDYSPIKELTNLHTLKLTKNSLRNIDFVGELSKLRYVDISDNMITSLLPLEKCLELVTIKANNNYVCDVKCLLSCGKLEKLELCNNYLLSVNYLVHLPNLKRVELTKNFVTPWLMLKLLEAVVTNNHKKCNDVFNVDRPEMQEDLQGVAVKLNENVKQTELTPEILAKFSSAAQNSINAPASKNPRMKDLFMDALSRVVTLTLDSEHCDTIFSILSEDLSVTCISGKYYKTLAVLGPFFPEYAIKESLTNKAARAVYSVVNDESLCSHEDMIEKITQKIHAIIDEHMAIDEDKKMK